VKFISETDVRTTLDFSICILSLNYNNTVRTVICMTALLHYS